MKILRDKRIQFILTGLFFILIINFMPIKTSTITMLTTCIVYSIAALGFNVLLGYTGQISLGHAAFIGLGAYVSAYVTQDMKLPFLVGMLAAGIIPIILGLILGLAALRLEGHYLAIATLGFGVAVQQTFKVLTSLTGGYTGKTAPSAAIFGMKLKGGPEYLTFAVILLVILCIVVYNIYNSKTGRAFIAMRDSVHSAQAMGIDVVKYKLIAFSISAFYAGIAGSLYMHLVKYTQPDVWGTVVSINLLGMVVIGGLASIGGSIIGAFFITYMPHLVLEVPVLKDIASASSIFTGLAIILVIRFIPEGVIYLIGKVQSKIFKSGGRKNELTESTESVN